MRLAKRVVAGLRWPRIAIASLAVLAVACSTESRGHTPADQKFQAPSRSVPKSSTPAEGPAPRPATPAPGAPSTTPVLSPQVVDSERVRNEVNRRLGHAARIVDGIDANRLAKDQQELYASLLEFLSKARAALAAEDLAGAQVLSEKASKLADALAAAR